MSYVPFSYSRLRRAFTRPRCCGFLVIAWILCFVIFCILTFDTPAIDRTVNQQNFEENSFGNYVKWDSEYKERMRGNDQRFRRAALIIHKSTKSATPKTLSYITRYLESFRIHYVIIRTDDRLLIDLKYEMTKDASKAKYSLIILYEFQAFLSLSRLVRDVINNYCAKFNAGQIFFAGNNYGKISEFNLEIKRVEKDKHHSLRVNPASKILWITKPGVETAKPSRARLTYIRVYPFDLRYETVAYLVPVGSADEMRANVRGEDTRVAMLLDDGKNAGIKRIFTTLNSAFFLHGLLFLDALKYLSVLPPKYTLHRFIQVDIDDIFIGKTGLRLKKPDVQELLQSQKFLQRKIPGFQFQIGFSGKGYGRGSEAEDEGDNELIAHASSFSWFCHMWDHEQAHKFDNLTKLITLMEKNKRFAKKHKITINSGYAVSSHHSGVYPVQESLYQAWKNVYGVSVTSTEEYPNLKPAWRRKGFQHMGIKVLPRQTCNVYTSTNFFREIEGGKSTLDRSVEGGEIFETILRNPVSIFMTHMTNYANDRLAPYLFKKLVKFVQRWTNLKLMSAPPRQLAEIYFKTFPEDITPVWQNPCDHNRHLAIWPIDKSCSRLPSLLVMGPPHGGHELLDKFLQVHPRMKGAEQDSNGPVETNFFSSDNYLKGLDWYMSFFPKQTELYEKIFEVSSTYFESTVASFRANALLKIAKIIFVLPDPVQRAYKHYMYMKNNRISSAVQKYSFEDFIMKKGKSSEERTLRNQLLTAGHYANHLTRWMSYYNPQQVMIISDDDLINHTRTVLGSIQDFVNIEKPINYNQLLRYDKRVNMYCPLNTNVVEDCYGYHDRHCSKMSDKARGYLQNYYAKHNKNLLRLNQKVLFSVPRWLKVYG